MGKIRCERRRMGSRERWMASWVGEEREGS
jgi:hypothetical protein